MKKSLILTSVLAVLALSACEKTPAPEGFATPKDGEEVDVPFYGATLTYVLETNCRWQISAMSDLDVTPFSGQAGTTDLKVVVFGNDTAEEKMSDRYSSCFAAKHDDFLSFFPRYWDATTAPPVANAENRNTNRFDTESTSDTPDTAYSPTRATMMVSIIPIVTDRRVSTKRGMIRLARYLLSNIREGEAFCCISSII